MGADNFETRATGRTAREAFRSAREEAGYESGHGGYSGTIYEKHEYVLFTLPPRLTVKRLLHLVSEVEYEGVADNWNLQQAKRYAATAPKGQVRKAKAALRQAERDHAKSVKRAERFWKALSPEVADLVRRVAEVANGDKWGPAAAVELRGKELAEYKAARKTYGYSPVKRGEKVFVFFGYASS